MTLTEENVSNPIQDEGDVAISHFPDDTGNDKQRQKTTKTRKEDKIQLLQRNGEQIPLERWIQQEDPAKKQ